MPHCAPAVNQTPQTATQGKFARVRDVKGGRGGLGEACVASENTTEDRRPNKGAPNQPLRPLHTQPHGTTPRSRTTDRCSQYICVCVCDGTQVKGNPGEGVGVTKNTPAAPTAPLPPLPPRNHTGTTPRSRETQCAVGPSRRRPCLLCFIPWLAWLTPHS